MKRIVISRWLLIFGLAFVFVVFGIWKFTQPTIWIGWIPPWMEGVLGLSRNVWLNVFGVAEIFLAALIIVPLRNIQRLASMLMALHLVAVVTQAGWTDVGVRDIGLFFAAAALFMFPQRKTNDTIQ